MASGDTLKIIVKGAQTHGALPWLGIDPIVIASQVVLGLQTIQSRQVNVLLEPSVITVGAINGGNRSNIIPDSVEMIGTIRTLDEGMRLDIHRRITNSAQSIAQSSGGSAEVTITRDYDLTTNDEKLAEFGARSLRASMGESNVFVNPKVTVSEDFSAYQKVIPGFFYFLGVGNKAKGITAMYHTPEFDVDEESLVIGVKVMSNLLLDYLDGKAGKH